MISIKIIRAAVVELIYNEKDCEHAKPTDKQRRNQYPPKMHSIEFREEEVVTLKSFIVHHEFYLSEFTTFLELFYYLSIECKTIYI